MSNVSALDRARGKLGKKVAANNSNVASEPFDLTALPRDRKDDLWTEIRAKYSLELDELGALKNLACEGNSLGLGLGYLIKFICGVYSSLYASCFVKIMLYFYIILYFATNFLSIFM